MNQLEKSTYLQPVHYSLYFLDITVKILEYKDYLNYLGVKEANSLRTCSVIIIALVDSGINTYICTI